MKLPIAPIQIVSKPNKGHVVIFFRRHNHITEIPLKVEFAENENFQQRFLKKFSTAEEQKPKIKPQLRQIDSEGHAKYGNSTPSMKRDILKTKQVTTSAEIDYSTHCSRRQGKVDKIALLRP